MFYNGNKRIAGREELLAFLDERSIAYEETHHSAVSCTEETIRLGLTIDGVRCKNLLMQDKRKKRLLLVVAPADGSVDAASLGRLLGCGRLSLCSAHTLRESLGVARGALSPLALINDGARIVELVIDDRLRDVPRMLFHPLVNTSTVALARGDWLQFLSGVGREPKYAAVRSA